MTKRELLQDYVSGRLDRRDFIARLTGFGVSGAAALIYAQSLTSPAAAAGLHRDSNGYLRSAASEYGNGSTSGNGSTTTLPRTGVPAAGRGDDNTLLGAGLIAVAGVGLAAAKKLRSGGTETGV